MPKEACSEDEGFAMGDRLHYRKIRPVWRSTAPDVVAWFKTLDHLHMSTRFKSDGKRKPGRIPRHRQEASGLQVSNPKVYPKGLPENFYDPTWLATLDTYERDKLRVQDPMELIFDDHVQRYVE